MFTSEHMNKEKQKTASPASQHEQFGEQHPAQTPAQVLQRAYIDPGTLTPGDVNTLQRSVGNRVTTRLLRPVLQRQGLTLGPADDQYEQEADRVAEQVVRQMDSIPTVPPRPQVQRDDLEEEELVQAKPLADYVTPVRFSPPVKRTFVAQRDEEGEPLHGPRPKSTRGAVEQSVQQQIQAARGGGQPLPDGVRSQMESGFGADFSNVRVHTGSQADTLNRSLNARAFTVGSDVFFKGGEFNPASSAGKKLLAHELTHTLQQGAASVQRKPNPAQLPKPLKVVEKRPRAAVQRFSFSNLFGRKKKKKEKETESPTISGPTNVQLPEDLSKRYDNQFKEAGTERDLDEVAILDMQGTARVSAQDSLNRATTLSARAKTKGRELREPPEVSDRDPDMMRARQDSDTKSDIKRGQRADATVHAFTQDAESQFDEVVDEIAALKEQVDRNGPRVAERLMGDNDFLAAYQLARQSHEAALLAQKKANDLAERVRSLEDQAELEAAKTRSGLQKPGEFGKEVDWGKLEMSASDAALRIEGHKAEILSYYLYLKADLGVVTNYMQQRARSLAKTYGKGTVAKIMASGYARGRSMGIAKPLSDDAALALVRDSEVGDDPGMDDPDLAAQAQAGNQFAQDHALEQREAPQGKGNKYLDPSLKKGKMAGLKSWMGEKASGLGESIKSGAAAGAKTLSSPFRGIGRGLDRKVFRRDRGKKIAKAREIQGLELMSVFYTQARKRFEDAERFAGESTQKYDAALATYDAVDAAKKEHETGNPQDINPYVRRVGKSWEDVMEVASQRAKLKEYKDQVAKESDKYSKFGARAMGGAKKFAYTLAGLGGTAVKTLTGGLIGWEKVDKDGGYSAGLKLTTIWDEIKKVWAEFKAIYATFKGKGLRGVGGRVGSVIYSILKITSVILGVIKNLAAAVALWSTILAAATVGGAGAVTGVATSIALYAAIAKVVIDAVLLVWSLIASKKTKDPRSRSKLRGDIARHGVGVGESLVTVAGTGLAAGFSGDYSAFTGGYLPGRGLDAPAGAFGKSGDSNSSHIYNAFNDNWSQNIGGSEFYFTDYLRTGANVGMKQAPLGVHKIGTGIAGAVNDDNMRHMKMQQDSQLKDAEKEARGKTKNAKGKLAKFADKVKVAAYDVTHLWRTPTGKRREQKQEMGRMFEELALAVEDINNQNQAIDEDAALEQS